MHCGLVQGAHPRVSLVHTSSCSKHPSGDKMQQPFYSSVCSIPGPRGTRVIAATILVCNLSSSMPIRRCGGHREQRYLSNCKHALFSRAYLVSTLARCRALWPQLPQKLFHIDRFIAPKHPRILPLGDSVWPKHANSSTTGHFSGWDGRSVDPEQILTDRDESLIV